MRVLRPVYRGSRARHARNVFVCDAHDCVGTGGEAAKASLAGGVDLGEEAAVLVP